MPNSLASRRVARLMMSRRFAKIQHPARLFLVDQVQLAVEDGQRVAKLMQDQGTEANIFGHGLLLLRDGLRQGLARPVVQHRAQEGPASMPEINSDVTSEGKNGTWMHRLARTMKITEAYS